MIGALLLGACQQQAELKVQPGKEIGGLKVGTVPKTVQKGDGRETSTEIPIALQGRWGTVAADCSTDTGNPDGLLDIRTSRLLLHHAEAQLRLARFRSPTALEADFAYVGEDRSWTQTESITLDGDTLYRKNAALQIAVRYERCPEARDAR